ncbi:hypothetical protein Ddc_04602 [Ditylenchus destructor]|nr:hypothetical protein Ddc_04602 [Ditylenchus destructor]
MAQQPESVIPFPADKNQKQSALGRLQLIVTEAQLFGSNFLNSLRGYGTDTCRFVSCPFGQYCLNGVCQVSTAAGLPYAGGVGLGGYGAGLGAFGGGLLGAAHKMCAETVDCYSGQTCMAGRCTFTTGVYGAGMGTGLGGYGTGLGGYGAGLGGYGTGLGGYGAGLGGYGTGLGGYGAGLGATGLGSYDSGYTGIYSPYGGYNALATLVDRPAGVMMCSLIQDCPNGQICVNGYCSQSNVAYGGSQAIKQPTTCATGAVCPVGQYCVMGICMQNPLSSTTACGLGTVCPYGMYCNLGRCQPNILYGKKRKR